MMAAQTKPQPMAYLSIGLNKITTLCVRKQRMWSQQNEY